MHVERRRLLVEAHELQARRAVLQQVDALLVVLDRLARLALVPERRADLAVQVADALELLLRALVLEALAPHLDRLVDMAHAQRDVALLLADPRDRSGIVRAADAARGRVAVDGLGVREQRRG